MSKKAARKPVSSATRRAKTAKVKSLKKPSVKAKFKVVTLFDGRPGVSDGEGNIAPFETLLTARRWRKWLTTGEEPSSALIWWNPKLFALRKAEWEKAHPVVEPPQPKDDKKSPQYVYALVELKGGRWGIYDGCGKVAPFGGSKVEVEGTRQRLVSGEFQHGRFVWNKEEPLHPVVENAPPVAHVWVQPGATSTIVEDTSKPPVWTAPVGMVLLDQAEEAYLRDRVSELSILNAKLKAECEGLKNDVLQAEANSDARQEQIDRLNEEVESAQQNATFQRKDKDRARAEFQIAYDDLKLNLQRERGESAKWLNKYLQLCQLTGQRAEPEGLDHPSVQIVGVKFEPKEHTPNVFEQPASQLTKLERAALDLAPMLELSDLDTDVSIRRIERLVDFAASILSECHSQSK